MTLYRGSLYAGVVFLLFGIGTKRQHLGSGQTRTCPHCHNTTQWARIREFNQFTLFFVPVARWKRRQLEECGICGTAVEV
nr:zinc-ribbon domain-containing protein [Rhodococcus sp. 14C212]